MSDGWRRFAVRADVVFHSRVKKLYCFYRSAVSRYIFGSRGYERETLHLDPGWTAVPCWGSSGVC